MFSQDRLFSRHVRQKGNSCRDFAFDSPGCRIIKYKEVKRDIAAAKQNGGMYEKTTFQRNSAQGSSLLDQDSPGREKKRHQNLP
jgi:hypothetical protein